MLEKLSFSSEVGNSLMHVENFFSLIFLNDLKKPFLFLCNGLS